MSTNDKEAREAKEVKEVKEAEDCMVIISFIILLTCSS